MNSMTMKSMKCFIVKGVTFLIKLVSRAINRSKEMHLSELIRFCMTLFWYKVSKQSPMGKFFYFGFEEKKQIKIN